MLSVAAVGLLVKLTGCLPTIWATLARLACLNSFGWTACDMVMEFVKLV